MSFLKALLDAILSILAKSAAAPSNPTSDIKFINGKPTEISDIGPIKEFEALRLTAYLPTPNDRWTIGWGHTATAKKGMVITEEQAEALLKIDMRWVKDAIVDYVNVPLSQPQYDALCSFIFNLGAANFRSSTLLRKLNAGDYRGAADEFPRWNKQRNRSTGKLEVLRGLTRRRAHERELFLKGTN